LAISSFITKDAIYEAFQCVIFFNHLPLHPYSAEVFSSAHCSAPPPPSYSSSTVRDKVSHSCETTDKSIVCVF
jgi:hypothetical protein